MKLRLQQAIQENEYYFRGFVRMADLAELFREYPFEEETLEKAAIHRRSMERGISSFTVTLRAMPDTGRTTEGGKTCFFADAMWGDFGMEKRPGGRFEQNDRGGTGRSRGRG